MLFTQTQPTKPTIQPHFRCKRRREDNSPEENLSCSQLLTKYANEDSDDDSDYIPIQEDEDESTISANISNDALRENCSVNVLRLYFTQTDKKIAVKKHVETSH